MPYAIPPDNSGRADPDTVICSARGCGAPASWKVIWNNPRIHTPDREKVWTACDEHREHLADYLRRRSMLRRVDPLTVDPLTVDPLTGAAADHAAKSPGQG